MTALAPKPQFSRRDAVRVAKLVCAALGPATERLIVAGSLRRRREFVGDVEILYIPRFGPSPADLFGQPENLADTAIEALERQYVLGRRLNVRGSETFGSRNKLMVHKRTGIPVDLFAATAENWWNYLVCRTGGAASNVQIASRAKELGYRWHPYGVGFSRGQEIFPMASEPAVFEFVSLPYREPWERE